MGSQLAAAQPDCLYDGIVGIWYGKAPGVDRATDALRHAVYAGTSMHGGAVAIVGDDPAAKSSTLPSSSAGALADMHMPVLYPGDPAEALDLGRHAIAMSRAHGPLVRAQDRGRRRGCHRERAPAPGADRSDSPARRRSALPPPPRRDPARAVQRRARARDLRGALRARPAVRGREPSERGRGGSAGARARHRRVGHHLPRSPRGVRAARDRERRRDPRVRHPPAQDGHAAAVRRRHDPQLRARTARSVRDRGEAAQHRGADQGRALRARGSAARGRQERRARRAAPARARRARRRHPRADPAPPDRGARAGGAARARGDPAGSRTSRRSKSSGRHSSARDARTTAAPKCPRDLSSALGSAVTPW